MMNSRKSWMNGDELGVVAGRCCIEGPPRSAFHGNFALSYFGFRLVVPIYTKRVHPFKSEHLHRGNWRPEVPHNKFFYQICINCPNSNNGICRSNSLSSCSARVGSLALGCSVETLFFFYGIWGVSQNNSRWKPFLPSLQRWKPHGAIFPSSREIQVFLWENGIFLVISALTHCVLCVGGLRIQESPAHLRAVAEQLIFFHLPFFHSFHSTRSS